MNNRSFIRFALCELSDALINLNTLRACSEDSLKPSIDEIFSLIEAAYDKLYDLEKYTPTASR